MMLCEECKREFLCDKNDPNKIFICRFCMGEGLNPNHYNNKVIEAKKLLDGILDEKWLVLRKDVDRLLNKIREVRRVLK